MKKILFSVLFSASAFSSAQVAELEYAKEGKPLVLIENAITGASSLRSIDPNTIESMSVFKSGGNNENLEPFTNFLKHGIIKIKLKKDREGFTKYPLLKLNEIKGLPQGNPVYIDGFLVKDNSAEIYEEAIIEIKTVDTGYGKVLNIWTLHEDERRLKLMEPPSQDPLQERQKQRPVYIKGIK